MVRICAACKIRKTPGDGLTFHAFPVSNNSLCRQWAVATKLSFQPTANHHICNQHFKDSDYIYQEQLGRYNRHLKESAVPSLLLKDKEPVPERKPPAKRPPPTATPSKPKNDKPPPKVPTSPTKDDLNNVITNQRKKIKSLQQQVRRGKEKLKTLNDVLSQLQTNDLLSKKTADVLQESFSGITLDVISNHLNNQDKSARGYRHSEEAKRFAITLHFYSPRAYEFVRTIFILPDPRSISHWTSTVKCEPGLLIDVFQYVQAMIKNDPYNADCILICDGMAIMQYVIFNRVTGSYDGFVNLGEGVATEEDETEASEALVFMLVSLRFKWKYPCGYVLIDKINANDLHCLLANALRLGKQHSLAIRGITMDGTSTNFSAMRKFGCKLGKSLESINGEFTFEDYDYPLYFVPDPPHMLKLGRNTLAELKVLMDPDGEKIEWKYIQLLHDAQVIEGLKYGNKLSSLHINYQRHKMNVKLAAQTLSSSVADAIEFMHNADHPFFKNAMPTVNFIRKIDRLFDFLNSRNPHGKGFKAPVRNIDTALTSHVVESSVNYIGNLTDENGVSILRHRRKTFALGLITTARGVKDLSQSLFTRKINPYSYLLTYRLSQDHLELTFNCVRGKLGSNNNPDVVQFKTALKKILLHATIKPSRYGNCVSFDNDESPAIFSLKWAKNRAPVCDAKDAEEDEEFLPFELTSSDLTDNKENILGYIGGCIVRSLANDLDCQRCCEAMLSSKSDAHKFLSLTALKDNGGLVYISEDVMTVLKVTERVFKQFVGGDDPQDLKISNTRKLRGKLISKVVHELSHSRVFINLRQHDMEFYSEDSDWHSLQIIKSVARKYLNCRMARHGQTYTKECLQKNKLGKRRQCNKLLHFQGL